ncbi:penicillin-binding transpeptidase domain-containing protein [Actinospica robiniae]|uniref:penicillin-binding transpeptidase domain-containing protein n=1 Tax=Actinospica robiniae TaxID=304901 RepID=UPI0012FB7B5A|nr:penicillin-binding transpeptidase domain-containing protein [Actinospica robiniae]
MSEPEPPRRNPKPRRRVPRRGVLGAVGALVVAVAVTLVATGFASAHGRSAAAAPTLGFSPDPRSGASGAQQTGEAFLAAWQRGDLHAAANLTDAPAAAGAALAAYQRDLHLSGLTTQPNTTGSAGWLTFSIEAQVGSPASPWSYTSGLAAYQGTVQGQSRWFVKWSPSIEFTSLKAGEHLALGTTKPTVSEVDDASGRAITSVNAPSLANLVHTIEQNATPSGGRAGTTVEIEKADGTVAGQVATVARPTAAAAVRTTIDLSVQAAAQKAADRAPNSSVAVVKPSTGAILAIANNPPGGPDTAMVGKLAPGSTFKVVSSATLLDQNLVTSLSQPVPCPKVLEADGLALHNSEQEAAPGNDFLQDFAQSCNNAFSSFYNKLTTSDISATARKYFGFDEPWDIGLNQPTTYAHVPYAAEDSAAEEMVGQDKITASPLAMASVAATVADGRFRQPILIPGTTQITADRMPADDLSNLRTLMHSVITQGTLAGVVTPSADTYGKTGTAEVGASNNSWTIAYRGDYAVCALAVDGGYGASVAGPEANSVLRTVEP